VVSCCRGVPECHGCASLTPPFVTDGSIWRRR
jgi:hypothetical protein